jgi:drug/metabolite transporter (DMT)-like permease
MFPFVLTLFAALLWAITNHIDKFLISKLVKNSNYRGLIVFSSLVSGFIMLPIYAVITQLNIALPPLALITIWLAMWSLLLGVLFYYKALALEDTSVVIIMFQLIPVFGYILGLIFFDEVLSLHQVFGGLIIIIASAAITYEVERGKFSKKKLAAFAFMILSSILTALYHFFFRLSTREHDFNSVVFWSNVAIMVNGIILWALFRSYRTAFRDLVFKNGKKAFFLNVTNEVLYTVGNIIAEQATLFAPMVVIMLIGGAAQPIFVFLIGIRLTRLLPKLAKENIKKTTLIYRSICILISAAGLALLLL